MQGLVLGLKRLAPAHWAFLVSLLLSAVAVHFAGTVAKDAAFYLDVAQTFIDQGLTASFARFNWPWFSMLLGTTHVLTGIPLETAAYLWCALFMAGACALLVDLVTRRLPGAGYWACLVVLAMPAFNQYRGDILREFGFWFFCVLALWLALRWEERAGWGTAALIQLSVLLAALFRLEAVVLMPALVLWQLPALGSRAGRLRLAQLVLVPSLLAVVALPVLLSAGNLPLARVTYYLQLIDPRVLLASFNSLADRFGSTLLLKYSADDAGKILFFGFLASALWMFVRLLGPFAVPLLFRDGRAAIRASLGAFRPFAWTALLYFVVLMFFFVQQQFINSRYTSFLDLLVVPFAAAALMAVCRRFPRSGKVLQGVIVLVMLANVISLSAKKTHYIEAGHWVAEHLPRDAAIYADDPRILYYAGWGYSASELTRDEAMDARHVSQFSYYLIEAKPDDLWLQQWLSSRGHKVLAQFANAKGATVLVIGE